MARENTTIEELRTYSRDLAAAARIIDEAAGRMAQAGMNTVLAHKKMVEPDYLPRITAFASDVLSVTIQTSLASPGRKTRIEVDMDRAKQQAAAKHAKKKPAK